MSADIHRRWDLRKHAARVHVSTRAVLAGETFYIDRGEIRVIQAREGASWRGVWQLVSPDHVWHPLLIVGDYLTAESCLLRWTLEYASEKS